MQNPTKPHCDRWLALIEVAKKEKERRFGKYAREGYNFYNGEHNFMWQNQYSNGRGGYLAEDAEAMMPTFQIQVNRIFEAVALFGPVLFHQYPEVTVEPRMAANLDPTLVEQMFGVPADQYFLQTQQESFMKAQASSVKAKYLNWLQVEGDKKRHSRNAITEAIVKGMGVLYTELYQPKGSQIIYPRSKQISCDQVIKDPDAKYSEDVTWMAVEWTKPANIVEMEFGLPPGSVMKHVKSWESQTSRQSKKDKRNRAMSGGSHDLVTYYEIYSKNGFGHRLKATNKMTTKSPLNFDFLGDFCRIVVCKGMPHPLNLPNEILAMGPEATMQAVQWPVPYWTDDSSGKGWPTSELGFWYDSNDVWPVSLVKPVIGELRFVNWCMSFLADKVAAVSHDYIGVMKAAAEDIREQVLNKTGPYTIIEVSEVLGGRPSELIEFINSPNFTMDIWKMVAEVLNLIDKRTGLTELVYGLTGSQMRSAAEANIRNDNINVRPQDMANTTEDWLAEAAKKECAAAIWALEPEDIAPVLGGAAAGFWDQYISVQDFDAVFRDYNYRIAAGSARRPNREGKLAALNDFGRVALPTMQQFASQGLTGPYNAYVEDVAKAMELDPARYQIELPEPSEGPDAETVEAMAEAEIKQAEAAQELAHKEELHQQEMDHAEETHDEEIDFARRMASARGPR